MAAALIAAIAEVHLQSLELRALHGGKCFAMADQVTEAMSHFYLANKNSDWLRITYLCP